MSTLEAALSVVRERLNRAVADHDIGELLTEEALRDAARLATLSNPAEDVHSAYALGMFHWFRYLALPDGADQEDLDAATQLLAAVFRADPDAVPLPLRRIYQQAYGHKEDSDQDADALASRAMEMFTAYQRTGELSLLTGAIALFRATAHAGHPDRSAVLSNLGTALRAVYERTGDVGVLEEAVQANRDAVAATPVGYPDPGSALSNLAAVLYVLFGRTGDIVILREAVRIGQDAVAATPADHPIRGHRLSNLSNALRALSERTGDSSALTEALQVGRDSIAATPVGHSDRASALNNLGGALQVLFRRTGDEAVLAEAVQTGRDAVAATHTGQPDRATALNNLGNALRMLFERSGDTTVLAEAVRIGRDAVAATHTGHPDRALHLNILGVALHALFRRTGDDAVLAEAVQTGRDAVAATHAGHPDHAPALNNLGAALQTLFERTGDTAVLAEAVQTRRDAVDATPADHPDRAAHLNNLGNVTRLLYRGTGDNAVLEEAVRAGRDAVAATPASHPDRAGRLFNLGLALHALYECTGGTPVLAEAGKSFAEAAGNSNAPVSIRIDAYRAVGEFPDHLGRPPRKVLAAMEAAVRLLPQIASHALMRPDREHSLSQLTSLAGRVAAAAVTAQRPERAVELLEQTRGVLVADTLDARSSDLTRLRSEKPGLAREFDELRTRIEALDRYGGLPLMSTGSADVDPDLARARRDTYAMWDELLARIRAIDGFGDFLQPQAIHQLARHTHGGPVVFIYTSPSRCDALILTDSFDTPVHLVRLTSLNEADARRQTRRLLAACQVIRENRAKTARQITTQREILDILAWTWDTITGPVLSALGYTTVPADGQPWPRVWWCPVGVLAYLPLHAAGHHDDLSNTAGGGHPRAALDYVVSSYIPTLRGLAYARSQHPDRIADRTVIIAVPDAPGAPPLDGVIAEADALTKLIPDSYLLPHPTRDSVLAALPIHRVAHFACHGYADWNNPSASRLILYDYETTPLTIADISGRHLSSGLAFLSACNTATTSPALANEAVHITGAFHLAGYQHVIGTLWPINDAVARDLACDVYERLTLHGTTMPDVSRTADALHHATRQLRDQYPALPLLWAAHTHTGA
jgi:CHAT domain/Tetratricopeptide repeat